MRVIDAAELRQKTELEANTRPSSNETKLSLEHELRLRRWAREYYVPAAERCEAWHDVILQEMELRDFEEAIARPAAMPRFVPLEPSIERRFDRQHELAGPHFMKAANRHRQQERLYADVVPGEMYYT